MNLNWQSRLAAALVVALAAGLLSAPASALAETSAQSAIFGVWRNKKDSVHIDIRPCGAKACGWVVWANDKAKEDARRGGTDNLVGLQLLRNFEPEKDGGWRGKVFVPDLNKTFSGSAHTADGRTLRARGCVFAGIFCKSQTWTRVGEAVAAR